LQLPSVEEIVAHLSGVKLTTIVFFLDETFEEVAYDITTSVAEAVEQLAGLIRLQNFQTFTLYEAVRMGLLLQCCVLLHALRCALKAAHCSLSSSHCIRRYAAAVVMIEAVEQLAGLLRLQNFQAFTLFEAGRAQMQ
jgi:hypothetical protein